MTALPSTNQFRQRASGLQGSHCLCVQNSDLLGRFDPQPGAVPIPFHHADPALVGFTEVLDAFQFPEHIADLLEVGQKSAK